MLRTIVESEAGAASILQTIIAALQDSMDRIETCILTAPVKMDLLQIASKPTDLRDLVRVPSSVNMLGSIYENGEYREMTEDEFCHMVLTPLIQAQKTAARKVRTAMGSVDCIVARLRGLIYHLQRWSQAPKLQVPMVFLVLVLAMHKLIPVDMLGTALEQQCLFPQHTTEEATFFYRIQRLLESYTFVADLKNIYGSVVAALAQSQALLV